MAGPYLYRPEKTDLSRLLTHARHKPRVSKRHFDRTTLDAYEQSMALPHPDQLETLSQCYHGVSLRDVRAAYLVSTAQQAAGFSDDILCNILQSVRKGDELVVIAQRALLEDTPEFIPRLVELVAGGGRLTHVAYLPEALEDIGLHHEWHSNHYDGAVALQQALADADLSKGAQSQVRYLSLARPDANDLAFLRAHDATLLLFRRASEQHLGDEVFSDEVWSGVMRHGRYRWTAGGYGPLDHKEQWLTGRCRLEVAGRTRPDELHDSHLREIKLRTLDDFVVSEAQRTARDRLGDAAAAGMEAQLRAKLAWTEAHSNDAGAEKPE